MDGPTHYAADGTLYLTDQLLDTIAKKYGYNVRPIKLPTIMATKTKIGDVITLFHPDIQSVIQHEKSN